jgi:hypothetical protein
MYRYSYGKAFRKGFADHAVKGELARMSPTRLPWRRYVDLATVDDRGIDRCIRPRRPGYVGACGQELGIDGWIAYTTYRRKDAVVVRVLF